MFALPVIVVCNTGNIFHYYSNYSSVPLTRERAVFYLPLPPPLLLSPSELEQVDTDIVAASLIHTFPSIALNLPSFHDALPSTSPSLLSVFRAHVGPQFWGMPSTRSLPSGFPSPHIYSCSLMWNHILQVPTTGLVPRQN